MSGQWEEINHEEMFGDQHKQIDPIVYAGTESSPELRWSPDNEVKRPPSKPLPKPVSTGQVGAEWLPGGAPKQRPVVSGKTKQFRTALIALVSAALPLGILIGVVVVVLRAYSVL